MQHPKKERGELFKNSSSWQLKMVMNTYTKLLPFKNTEQIATGREG